MRVILALIVGILIGAAAVWYYTSAEGHTRVQAAGAQVANATKPVRDTVEDKLRGLNLTPEAIKDELARTGQVVRRKAQEAGQAIADATADTRITTTIKARLVANPQLPARTVSVSTSNGVVTLSGTVDSAEDLSKVMALAMETDGVREVVSKVQVTESRPK